MEIQRKRKDKTRSRKQESKRNCDFVIEETKRYSGEIYGKQFEDDVCTEHPYHNHVLKIRNKDEIDYDLEEALLLEEIQRDYDGVVDFGDTIGADNTRDSGFLSVRDIDDEPNLHTVDATAEEFGDFTIHTIRADIETLTDRTVSDRTNEITEEPEQIVLASDNIIRDDKETISETNQVTGDNLKEFRGILATESSVVNEILNDSNVPLTSKSTRDIVDNDQVVTSKLVSDKTPAKVLSVETEIIRDQKEKSETIFPETNKKHRKYATCDIDDIQINKHSTVTSTPDSKGGHYRDLPIENESKSGWDIPQKRTISRSRTSSIAEKNNNETTISRTQSLKSEKYSDIKGEWDPLEPELKYERDSAKRYRHSSQISRRSLQENYDRNMYRNESFTSATSFPISRSQSIASTAKSVASTTDSMGRRPRLRRSMSASFIHSMRSFKRSLRSSLRSLAGSLRSLTGIGESLSKTKRRTQSLKSLPSETKVRKERPQFKRYSLDSLSSRAYYDPSKSRLQNEVDAFERRKKLMEGYCRQADYMEKCFNMKDRKDEPYRGSMRQYKECLQLCTRMDLERQRQKPLQEEDGYKHIPYMDQDFSEKPT